VVLQDCRMESRPLPAWLRLFDRFVARWLFAAIALAVLFLAMLVVASHGVAHLLLSLPLHLLVLVLAGGLALVPSTPRRRRSAVICLVAGFAAIAPNLLGLGGDRWRGLLTVLLLLPVLVLATREWPAVVATAELPAPEVRRRSFRRPVLVLNPRSGGAQAARDRLQEAAHRHGVEVRQAASPTELVEVARQAVSDGADVLGVAGGDGSLAAVATVALEAELPFVCVPAGTRNHFARDLGLDRNDPAAAIEAFVSGAERRVDVATVAGRVFLNNVSIGVYAALVHEPSYRDDRLGAVDSVLGGMLDNETPTVRVSFQDGSGQAWEQVIVLLISNNAYSLTGFGSRPRLDAGMLEMSALRRTDGQQLGRALENLAMGRYDAGDGWARWAATTFEVDSPDGKLGVGIDGEAVVLDTPIEFKIQAGVLHVLLPPPGPSPRRPSEGRTRRLARMVGARGVQAAGAGQWLPEELARLARLWRLLNQIGRRFFGDRTDHPGTGTGSGRGSGPGLGSGPGPGSGPGSASGPGSGTGSRPGPGSGPGSGPGPGSRPGSGSRPRPEAGPGLGAGGPDARAQRQRRPPGDRR
jgi:diacylglycerol kinase family enzyme